MSLAIDPRRVTGVLLPDGWHIVLDRSFGIDAYEFVEPSTDPDRSGTVLHGGERPGASATGFAFRSDRGWIAGPLGAVRAVSIEDDDDGE